MSQVLLQGLVALASMLVYIYHQINAQICRLTQSYRFHVLKFMGLVERTNDLTCVEGRVGKRMVSCTVEGSNKQ
ncbi:Hypothetical predicted protein [Olea europaea subsp. europaea]|uniref:Uncharacterized protein n=1 Tax=Olea europaea subsp. europaea TaxID=158383 RepID=A0A8S0T8Y2_OLEEU|nr:Hypothetical predicted protein [Olea europaea subsp. europaea]